MKTLLTALLSFLDGLLALFGLERRQATPAALAAAKAGEAVTVAAADQTEAASVEQAQIDASVAVKQAPAEFLNDFIITDYKKDQ